MSVAADQREMQRRQAVAADPRRRSAGQASSCPVATHWLKSLLDMAIAGFALLLFLPLLLVVMMVIRLESPGSSIFASGGPATGARSSRSTSSAP